MATTAHSRSCALGLALGGGSVRAIAHIGVIKALAEHGIRPAVVTGTSAGSLVGAAIAAGMEWQDLRSLAETVFWPSLLNSRRLEHFCSHHLPLCFADLRLPFAAIATTLPQKQTVILKAGALAPAISASCAVRVLRRSVYLNGQKLKDGGISCVLPARECRELGAEFVIASDVWERSGSLRRVGLGPTHPRARRIYPLHYLEAVRATDLLIQPNLPLSIYWPGMASVDRLIRAGEAATRRALTNFPPGRLADFDQFAD